jgi:hypothetical protein
MTKRPEEISTGVILFRVFWGISLALAAASGVYRATRSGLSQFDPPPRPDRRQPIQT